MVLKALGVERTEGLDQDRGRTKVESGVVRNLSQGQGFAFLEKFLLSQRSEAASTDPFIVEGGWGPLKTQGQVSRSQERPFEGL